MFAAAPPTVNQSGTAKSTIARALDALGSFLAPPLCVLCDRPGLPGPVDLCASCLADLPWVAVAETLPGDAFALCCCPWSFSFPIDALLRALKFRGERGHARLLGTLLARQRRAMPAPLPECVIPVPLHPLRLRARGYNQAAELARFAARELGLPLDQGALQRLRPTREQTGLRSQERVANVHAAFRATRPLCRARVALVDDVITTGSTVRAAAEALGAAGASAVEVWAVARATRLPERSGIGSAPAVLSDNLRHG
jgi:ComF family protein